LPRKFTMTGSLHHEMPALDIKKSREDFAGRMLNFRAQWRNQDAFSSIHIFRSVSVETPFFRAIDRTLR